MTSCRFCGTLTGVHGFAFNREGSYGELKKTGWHIGDTPAEKRCLDGWYRGCDYMGCDDSCKDQDQER